ncbi:hypothetical protein J437_LFUL017050 [Ladona fulva]|uniref:Homeobox domain-containing protein n=1 Tax=Ladona fulva TaxID=123851 RepID=A0A8K0KLR9_LADFU|nr:hypothetical protein J437_LFUL017050 [Ladona fulva]
MLRHCIYSFPSSIAGKTRTKDKYRVVYSDRQRLELEKEFHYSRYITIRRKSELAAALGLSDRQVKIWFQNRRAKERKHLKKREEVSQKDKLDTDRDPMPPDLIPPQLSIPLHHSQHLHHHHPDMTEVQQQQPPMGLQMPGVATPGVDL